MMFMTNVFLIILAFINLSLNVKAQENKKDKFDAIDVSGFANSAHHWYDITDNDQAFLPVTNQKRYDSTDIRGIADNILLYQQVNGGWAKNYDMLAILTTKQRVNS